MTRTNEAGETHNAGTPCTPAPDAQPVYPHTMRLQRFLARAGVPGASATRISPASLVLVMHILRGVTGG